LSWTGGSLILAFQTMVSVDLVDDTPSSDEDLEEWMEENGYILDDKFFIHEKGNDYQENNTNVLRGANIPYLFLLPNIQNNNKLTPSWGSNDGTSYNTHRRIAEKAYIAVKNYLGALYVHNEVLNYGINSYDLVLEYTRKADTEENGPVLFFVPTFEGHFYGANGKSWTTSSTNTAYTKFNNHYWEAVKQYINGNKTKAYQELGLALHYIADLNEPHHAANVIATENRGYHSEYELWVDQNCLFGSPYIIEFVENGTFKWVLDRSIKTMADSWSSFARAQIDNARADFENSIWTGNNWNTYYTPNYGKWEIAAADCLPRAIRASAGIIYRFLAETNQLNRTYTGSYQVM